jgi:hypothetical protein
MNSASRPISRRTPDTSITDAYYSEAAQKLLERIKADGWTIAPPRTRWAEGTHPHAAKPSGMSLGEAEESLRSCLYTGLMLYRFKPPRSRDPASIDDWRRRVAEKVVKDILQSNWALAWTLLKLPPAPPHSTSRFMRKED